MPITRCGRRRFVVLVFVIYVLSGFVDAILYRKVRDLLKAKIESNKELKTDFEGVVQEALKISCENNKIARGLKISVLQDVDCGH